MISGFVGVYAVSSDYGAAVKGIPAIH